MTERMVCRRAASRTAMLIAAVGMLCLATAGAARAQEGPGVQVGVSAQPNQFYVGAHYVTAPIVEQAWFRPNLEVGVGHAQTFVTLNFDFVDRLPLKGTPWKLYFGGGPALNIDRHNGTTDSGGGLNIVLGVVHPKGLFTEIKVGLVDSPSFKFGVGYTFGQ